MYWLLALAFLLPLTNSTAIFTGLWHPSAATTTRLLLKLLIEIASLLALYAVLASQQRNFTSIGFSPVPNLSDVGNSLLLLLWALICAWASRLIINLGYLVATGHPPSLWRGQSTLFGATVTFLPFLFAIVNPFFEELLVRAFLITEVEKRFGSIKVAAVSSIVLQSSYHLYQGLANALTLAVLFSILTVFYVKTRRIWPVILCHMYMDLSAVIFYALRLQSHR